jgi:hypothetical protein
MVLDFKIELLHSTSVEWMYSLPMGLSNIKYLQPITEVNWNKDDTWQETYQEATLKQ